MKSRITIDNEIFTGAMYSIAGGIIMGYVGIRFIQLCATLITMAIS